MEENELKELITVVQTVVLRRGDVSVEDLANVLGKRPSTLYNEINPNHTGTAKLGALDLIRVMRMLKDISPLEHMAALMGCMVTPVPSLLREEDCPAPTPDHFAALLDQLRRLLDELGRTVRASKDGEAADPEQCLDILLACQACNLALGELSRIARQGAVGDSRN